MQDRNISPKKLIAASHHIKERDYWLNKLSGGLERNGFYPDYKVAGNFENCPANVNFSLTGMTLQKILKLSNYSDFRLHVILVTGLIILSSKYTSSTDSIVGTPAYKQQNEEHFINTLLILRNHLPKETTFKQLLLQVRDTIAEGEENINYPIEVLAEQLGMSFGKKDIFPLCEIAILLENVQDKNYLNHFNINIIFSFRRNDNSINGEIQYNSLLYKKETIERMAMHFITGLSGCLANSEMPIESVDLFTAEENRQLLFEFNKTETVPADKTIQELFENQVKKTPDHKAIIGTEPGLEADPPYILTFKELNSRANRLAVTLKNKGVRADHIVAFIFEPSPLIIVAIWATLKAGAAYMPIAPEYPEMRIKYMLKDSESSILLTHNHLKNLSDRINPSMDILYLDEEKIYGKNDYGLTARSSLTDTVYTIYTSGTTGKPKGVLVKNQSLINYVNWFKEKTCLQNNDKSVLTSSYAFDLGYSSIFPVILSGGELHIIPRETYLLSDKLLNYIDKNGITYIKVTPSLLSIMVKNSNFSPGKTRKLRLIVLGGEAINLEDVQRVHQICEHIQVINHYGPTEATIGCIAQYIDFKKFTEYRNSPTIGEPIHNTHVYIMTPNSKLTPIGVPGELAISGKCLARGYLNQPELTAQKFTHNPFHNSTALGRTHNPFDWIYKTGDRARWLPEGKVEFMGRMDEQVKIRGYRIELKEIENKLLRHPQIEETVIVENNDETDGKYLCAYFVPKKEEVVLSEKKRLLSLKEIAEIEDLKIEWDNKLKLKNEISSEPSIIQCFKNQASQNKKKISMVSGGRNITYEDLNKYVDKIALRLMKEYNDKFKLSKPERIRYSRQMLLYQWGMESQEKLKSATIFVAGAGGGASPTLMQLALAGFGTIIVCDYDDVELSNLNRQFLHNESRIGMNKALSAQVTLQQVNPYVKVIPIVEKLTKANVAQLVGDADILFDMFDGLEAKFILSEYATSRGIPHLISAMTDINGYTVVFNPPHTPCYHCLFDKRKWETIVAGMGNYVQKYEKNPLPVVATSLFLTSSFIVNEAIKIVLGFENPAFNKFFFFNQRGTTALSNTPSFQAMTHVFSDHFRKLCANQGFDWNVGWRGNYLEELKIEPDPKCIVCNNRKNLTENSFSRDRQSQESFNLFQATRHDSKRHQTVALFLDNEFEIAAGILGTIKSRKSYVPLDPTCSLERLKIALEDSEARVILTETSLFHKAEKLRDTINKNIKIIDISDIEEAGEMDFDFPEAGSTLKHAAYLLYPFQNNGEMNALEETHEDILQFLYYFNDRLNSDFLNRQMLRYYSRFTLNTLNILGYLLRGETCSIKTNSKKSDYSLSQLSEYLTGELPDYMIPSYFISVDRIPLTANGKVNKKLLPNPKFCHAGKEIISPRDKIEKKLVAIWAEVLGLDKETISINSNFFQLGGHSLKVTILVSMVHKELNVNLPLQEVFQKPDIIQLAQYIKNAAEEKYYHIDPVEKKEYYRLSSGQNRMYVLQQMELDSIGYNTPQIEEITAGTDLLRLERAFKQLLNRHESLRTSFEIVNGEPVQRVHDSVEFSIESYALNNQKNKHDIIYQFIRPFNLAYAPLLRVGVIKTGSSKDVLMIDMHHIISDGLSRVILIQNFQAFLAGEELPGIKLQYKDFSEWQNSESQQIAIKRQETYWLGIFSDEIPIIDLPIDYTRPNVQGYEGNRLDFTISVEETKKIQEMAAQSGVTIFMYLLAVYYIFLARVTSQQDIIVGTPIAGRRHADLGKIIGLFINTLALRNQVNDDISFLTFLEQLKQSTLDAFENQDYQFEDLVKNVALERDTSRNPLFDVMFSLRNLGNASSDSGQEANAAELPPLPSTYESHISKFDLTLDVAVANQLFFLFEYSTKLFKKTTIERFVDYFKRVLYCITEYPHLPISQVEIISQEEKECILLNFNRSENHNNKYLIFKNIWEDQVEKRPDRVAIVFKDSQLTYRSANQKANQLARSLRGKGVVAETIVPIMLERSLEMIVAVWAVQKAGGAYLPVDPSYPLDRIDFMLQDSSAEFLVTQDNLLGKNNFKGQIIDIKRQPVYGINTNLENIKSPCNIAYVIYTSGSTGKPKGVIVQNDQYLNTAFAWRQEYKLDEIEINLLQMANFSFDVFAGDLARVFLNGGTMVICPEDVRIDPPSLYTLILNHRITLFEATPALIIPIMEYIHENNLEIKNLRLLILGSDICHVEDFRKILIHFGDRIRIVNSYGVTEATIDSSYYEETLENLSLSGNVPIGTPLPNMSFYILSYCGNLQPVGIAGELYIGGCSVSRGYLNRISLTAERFIANPFKPGEQMYKTGDRARWLPDGNVEFLGRFDDQVKIRGYRIEIGEIESCLLKHPAITEALVIARKNKNSQSFYLCAYLISSYAIKPMELKEYLSAPLPDYMVPPYFIIMDKFPLTPNGKINRRALPNPEDIEIDGHAEYGAPRDEIEEILVKIWKQILGRDNIGINDNFFLIGGDSIKTIQMISRMKKNGYIVNMRDIFQRPTISQLSPFIRKSHRIPDQTQIMGEFPLTPIQKTFLDIWGIHSHHYNQAVMFYSRTRLEPDGVRAVFKKIQEHHDILRVTYKKDQTGGVLQFNHGLDFPLSLEVYDLTAESRKKANEILSVRADQIQASIDLENGPLLKLGLFHLDDGDRLLIVIHHLIVDGVSWRILFEDIENLYRQYLQYKDNVTFELPLKSDSFKLWAERLNNYACNESFLEEASYWAQIEAAEIRPFKKDSEGSNAYNDAARSTIQLEQEDTNRLLLEVNKAFGTDLKDILLTSFGLAVKETFDIDKMLIALEGHGREDIFSDIDISRTIGWFTTEYPIILNVSYETDEDCIINNKEYLRQIPNKGIGYGILKYLTPPVHKQNINFRLRPEISFNFLGQFDSDARQMSFFTMAKESPGNMQSPYADREFQLQVSGAIAHNQLTMALTYSKNQYKTNTISRLMENFKSCLIRLINFCASRKETRRTPSDFTYKKLSLKTLEQLEARYSLEDIYSLSHMQEGMLFHALYDIKSSAYFEQVSYRLIWELEPVIVVKSLNRLFERYDILRTVFIYEDIERPIQLVLKNRQVEFFYKDLIDEPNSKNKDAYIKAFKEKDRQRSFDLSRDILMRVAVIRISLSEYEFIWSHHHILMDGWCTSILITEFFEIYKNYQEGKTCLLPDVKPYRVYIQWLEKQDRKKSKNYWAAYLDGYEQLNGIPLAQIREKNVNEKYCGHAEILLIEKNYSEKLARIAAAANVTLNTVIQALWGILIGKYNNSTDVVFGAVVSGRPSEIPGIERMIGLFINTVPIRIRWEEKNVFKYLIRKIQDEAIENESHHYYSLADIQAASFLKQDLLDHILIFENLPIAEQIEGLAERSPKNSTRSLWKLSNIESFEQTNYNFNLTIIAGEQLALKFEYNALIYQQEDVQQLAQCFNSLVMQITAHEEMQIRELTLISEKEKECILYEFNPVDGDKAYHKTFLMLFQEQVARVPNNVALVGRSITAKSGLNEVQCTYSVLDIAAGRLALLLREKGIRPGIIAGIMLNRCIELIVSLLAVLKSGGAYVPIDPAYPADRIRYMLDYSGIPLLISINGLVRNIPFHREVIDLQNAKMLNVNNDLQEEITFMDLAYIIFTSGSTGNPKGVMVQHDQYVNTALAWRREYRLDEIEINLLQMAAFSFDVFAGDVARALGNGGKLIICPEETRTDYISLHRLIVTHRITIFEATPALTIPFMDYIYENNMELCHLKLLIVGSDTCYVEDFKRLLSRFGSRMRIVNSYGVTEATIDTSYFEGNLNSLPTAGNVPIGKPLPKMKIYILDFWGNLLPAGITGELYIGGDSVARGYLNQPQLTAQHFFPDPFFPGKRIYKTGDRAKWLKDGNIQFLGRFDYQVKIRGYRIELGEIENQLLGHPNIEKAIVITTGNLLAAYIVFDIPLDIFQLRDYLSRHLPTFMMPTHIIPIKEMPLSPNGKIDRKALPPPVLDGNDYGYIPPRYDKEKTMAHIWAEVLGLNPGKISIESNFFQIGGHSLNAVVLASKIHKEFNIRIPVAQIFNSPTITEMLAFLAKSDPDMFDPIEPAEKRDYYPFSASQKRIYFVDMMRQDLSYNMPSILLAEGFIDLEKLENAFKCFVQRHESCRTSFHVMNGTYIQRVYDAVPFEIEYYEASNQTEADRLVNHFIRRFELNRVPLFRGGVIRLEKEKHIVMIDMHHIISDQVSDNIFKKEILAFYTGQQLPSLKIQYKDYALWQNSPKKQQAIEKQKKFWLNHLKGEIPKVNLPLDYPRPRIQLYEALNVSFEISPGETEALRQLLLEKRGTIFIGLLTVFNILLAKISAQDDIIVGTGLAGRQHTDLQNVVGYFVNTLVLRNNLSANKTLSSILEEVKENTIQAFENQEYEFEDLLQQFRSQQGSERSHLFDVFLTLETLPINVTGETSLTSSEDILFKLRPYKYDTPTAKADLALIGVDDGKKLSLVFRYCTSLFKEDTIQKFVRYFKIILTSLIENPQCKIIELELLSKEEKNKALEQVKKDREIIQTEFDLD